MLAKSNNSVIHLQPRRFLRTKYLKTKLAMENALIEQIIELQLRGPGPPGRTCTPIIEYFHDKTKIS